MKRLICWLRGHDWYEYFVGFETRHGGMTWETFLVKCRRCDHPYPKEAQP
jgi:hypothetical protein